MQNILTKIDELSSLLKKMLPMKPEFQVKLDKKFRMEFNYNSNHIEGNTLTYSETELLLIFDETKGNHTKREYDEMQAHDVAFQMIEEWGRDKERPLTEQSIKNLNELILVKPFWKDAITQDGQATRRLIKVGDYKEFPNSVRLQNGELFDYASPVETPILMNELINWYRDEETSLHPVTLATMLHYKFVRIHPFDDGNGRIARLLMNYVFLKNQLPPVIIKSSEKQNYLSALHLADVGNYEPLIEYVANQLIWSLEISIKAAKGENISEYSDLDKELVLLKRELSGENILSNVISVEAIRDAIVKNIVPLFNLIEQKCKLLEEYFFKTNSSIQLEINNVVSNTELRMLKRVITDAYSDGKTQIRIRYSYEFSGFKKTVAAYNYWINIDIRFEDYNYRIDPTTNRDNGMVVPYGKIFKEEDLIELATPALKEVIEGIKHLIQVK